MSMQLSINNNLITTQAAGWPLFGTVDYF